MGKLSLSTVTEADAVDFFGALGDDTRHAPTTALTVAAPVAGIVNARFAMSAPDTVVSTVSHEPSVNLNSTGPRTVSGNVSAKVPSLCSAGTKPGALGFQPLNDPAT